MQIFFHKGHLSTKQFGSRLFKIYRELQLPLYCMYSVLCWQVHYVTSLSNIMILMLIGLAIL